MHSFSAMPTRHWLPRSCLDILNRRHMLNCRVCVKMAVTIWWPTMDNCVEPRPNGAFRCGAAIRYSGEQGMYIGCASSIPKRQPIYAGGYGTAQTPKGGCSLPVRGRADRMYPAASDRSRLEVALSSMCDQWICRPVWCRQVKSWRIGLHCWQMPGKSRTMLATLQSRQKNGGMSRKISPSRHI